MSFPTEKSQDPYLKALLLPLISLSSFFCAGGVPVRLGALESSPARPSIPRVLLLLLLDPLEPNIDVGWNEGGPEAALVCLELDRPRRRKSSAPTVFDCGGGAI